MGLPADLVDRAEAACRGEDDPEAVARLVVRRLDNQHPDHLVEALDELRERCLYPVSIVVLEEAWASFLEPDLAGRVAEDWVGTVLHGLGDRAGAEEVAGHLVKDALQQGPQFCGELGHVLVGWGLVDAADPLLREAARARPGDVAVQYDLGVLLKLRNDWPACRAAFASVVAAHPDEKAGWWQLGIAATAQSDWAEARRCWAKVGFSLPAGDGDFAAPYDPRGGQGEPTPVRLKTAPGAPAVHEVVWGVRLCPARVRITGLPRWPDGAEHGDVVLVDGAPVGDVRTPTGEVPVLPALAVLERLGGQTFSARVSHPDPVVEALVARGWPAANWTGLEGPDPRVAFVVAPGRDPEAGWAHLRDIAPEAEPDRWP